MGHIRRFRVLIVQITIIDLYQFGSSVKVHGRVPISWTDSINPFSLSSVSVSRPKIATLQHDQLFSLRDPRRGV